MVGRPAISFFDGFVLLNVFRFQIHLLPEWQVWGTFQICINPIWPSVKFDDRKLNITFDIINVEAYLDFHIGGMQLKL